MMLKQQSVAVIHQGLLFLLEFNPISTNGNDLL